MMTTICELCAVWFLSAWGETVVNINRILCDTYATHPPHTYRAMFRQYSPLSHPILSKTKPRAIHKLCTSSMDAPSLPHLCCESCSASTSQH